MLDNNNLMSNVPKCSLHNESLKVENYQPLASNIYVCKECEIEQNSLINEKNNLVIERAYQDFLRKHFSYLVVFPFFYTIVSIAFEIFNINFIYLKVAISIIFLFIMLIILKKLRIKKIKPYYDFNSKK